jgi:hypothetical protein
MSSALLQIETEIKERLESIPFFEPFATRDAILVEPRKNLLAEINKKISQLQTVIVPKIVGADDNHPNVNGVYFDSIRISVGVFQKDLLKGSDAGYIEIAEEIHKALKNWTPDSLVNAINPAKPGIEIVADDKLNIAACNFETCGGFVGELPRVATPEMTGNPGEPFILACATAGAAIFYTTNGTNPTPRNGTLYLGAVITPTFNYRARAYLAGFLRSELLSGTYIPT